MLTRFYNAGKRIDETILFSLPDGGDIHYVGRWPIRAPEKGWFEVPSEVEVQNTSVAVRFIQDIRIKFGERGVVMLDPKWNASTEDPDKPLSQYAVAATEEEVIARAEELWRRYLRKIVEAHLADCQAAMAAGGAPRAASGFTSHALKLLNIQDPGEQYFMNLQKGQGAPSGASDDVKAILQSQGQMMQSMMTMFMAMASGKKFDAEELKAAMEPAKTPETLTTGVMTGKVNKPVDLRGSGPDADIFDRKVKGKSDRSKEAAAAL